MRLVKCANVSAQGASTATDQGGAYLRRSGNLVAGLTGNGPGGHRGRVRRRGLRRSSRFLRRWRTQRRWVHGRADAGVMLVDSHQLHGLPTGQPLRRGLSGTTPSSGSCAIMRTLRLPTSRWALARCTRRLGGQPERERLGPVRHRLSGRCHLLLRHPHVVCRNSAGLRSSRRMGLVQEADPKENPSGLTIYFCWLDWLEMNQSEAEQNAQHSTCSTLRSITTCMRVGKRTNRALRPKHWLC